LACFGFVHFFSATPKSHKRLPKALGSKSSARGKGKKREGPFEALGEAAEEEKKSPIPFHTEENEPPYEGYKD
jgi:hypothetical protein